MDAMQQIADIEKRLSKSYPIYYVFTDDVSWAKQIFYHTAKVQVIEQELSEVERLLLLVEKFDHFIFTFDSISWWAANLSDKNNRKQVIVPQLRKTGLLQTNKICNGSAQYWQNYDIPDYWRTLNPFKI
ncbi:glycosyltransferase family 11 [Stylonychia lemnae]|uniref:Glycosyltransferase family 11 n=1 Tax=Stylonychia lemnae TaxID=5949 RepID=A0A078A4X1_STYLE|nr:glycosyltransferase family 11 [Stylonychia lemnae]|eukprot:CDW76615.1 glycosyltransferase family 11 [Stylonychia lemnae]